MPKRKICVVTGSRAEYGLLCSLLKNLQADTELDLQLVVTGMHLSSRFGSTYKVIEEDGFLINHKVDLALDGDSALDIARSVGRGTIVLRIHTADYYQILFWSLATAMKFFLPCRLL